MKKIVKAFMALLAVSVCSFAVVACEKEGKNPPAVEPPVVETPDEESGKTIEGVTFSGVTYTYDGEEKQVVVTGTIPDGVSVQYTDNKATNAGNYTAQATLSGEGYRTLTLTAAWEIKKADISDSLTFADDTVEYDNKKHELVIVGNPPAGVIIEYYYNGEKKDGVTAVGTYEVRAVLSGPNHNEKILTATLKIKSTEERLFCINHNGTLFFQNALDENKLYKTTATGSIEKVSGDTPEYMISADNVMYYFSTGLLNKVIKSYDTKASVLLDVNNGCEYLATDGEYLYYAVNNLLFDTKENGIYRIALDGSEENPVRISTDKAAYLCYYDGYIYYANITNNDYLCRVAVTASNATGTVLWEEKSEYIIEDNGVLYFNSTKGLVGGSAIRKYVISSGKNVKLTTDSGRYLAKIGSYIYYINDDFLTGQLFGKNICKASALSASDVSLPGTVVLRAENDAFSSLASDGEKLYYYRLNDKHFYSYEESQGKETDLMEAFTPIDNTILSGESRLVEYKGEIYYTNPLEDSCLYKYNPVTRQHVKVLASNVAGVWFNGDSMYYSTYVLTNYALFKMNIETGESVKVNSHRCEYLTFKGEDIYYLQVKAGDDKIIKLKSDGTEEEIFAEQNISAGGFVKHGDTFYFVNKSLLMAPKNLCSYSTEKGFVDLKIKAELFTIDNEVIYYYAQAIKSCASDGSNIKTIVNNVKINEIRVLNGKLYYSSFGDTKGFYVYDFANKKITKINDNVADGFIEYDGKIYFLQTAVTYGKDDYPAHEKNGAEYCGDGELYCYDGDTVKKL